MKTNSSMSNWQACNYHKLTNTQTNSRVFMTTHIINTWTHNHMSTYTQLYRQSDDIAYEHSTGTILVFEGHIHAQIPCWQSHTPWLPQTPWPSEIKTHRQTKHIRDLSISTTVMSKSIYWAGAKSTRKSTCFQCAVNVCHAKEHLSMAPEEHPSHTSSLKDLCVPGLMHDLWK